MFLTNCCILVAKFVVKRIGKYNLSKKQFSKILDNVPHRDIFYFYFISISVDSAKRKITVDKTMSTVSTTFNHSMPTKCAINAQSCVIKPSVE